MSVASELCEQITTRRTWCRRKPRPGLTTCETHADGPLFDATYDDYGVADATERERAAWESLPVSD